MNKELLFKKFSSFDIPEEVLENIYDNFIDFFKDESEFNSRFNYEVQMYIVNEIKKDNIEMTINVIENFAFIKKMILINPKYNVEELNKNEINRIYEQAIDLFKERYNDNNSISINISDNMRYLITRQLYTKDEDMAKYDMSFLEEYMNVFEIDKNTMCDVLDCEKKDLTRILDGRKLLKNDEIKILYTTFNVDNYDNLKEKIYLMIAKEKIKKKEKEKQINKTFNIEKEELKELKKEITAKKEEIKKEEAKIIKEEKPKQEEVKTIKEEMPKTDSKEKVDKDTKRDMSFMKEFVELYNYTDKKLVGLWHCGIKVVPKILNGQVLIKEEFLWETYTHFGVNNYEALKEKIEEKVRIKKENLEKFKIKQESIKKEVKNINEKKVLISELDRSYLLQILELDKMKKHERTITLLLFSPIVDRSIEEIADFLEIDKNYVSDVYKKDLLKIENKLKETDNNVKLIYKSKE